MVSQMLDGSITPQDQERLERHLEHCAACRATWQQLQAAERKLKVGITVPPSPTLTRKLEASLLTLSPRRSSDMGAQGYQLGLLVAPFLLLCTMVLMTLSTVQQQPMRLVHAFLGYLPRIIAYILRVLHSDLMQHWALRVQILQSQLQDQLHSLSQMSGLQSVLVGYLGTLCLLGLAGLYLLARLNLQSPEWAKRASRA